MSSLDMLSLEISTATDLRYYFLFLDLDLSLLLKLQLVRSNSRRFMPSQIDEEIHQLSYLQKHMANILHLLAEPAEGEGEESLVCHITLHFIEFGEVYTLQFKTGSGHYNEGEMQYLLLAFDLVELVD